MSTWNTPFGLFKFNRLPYGVSSAPTIFQRTLEGLLKDLPNVVVYIDDLLVTEQNVEEHDKLLAILYFKG